MAERQGDLTRLCGLWQNETKTGGMYLSGNLGAARLLVFPNGRKNTDRDPDWIAYVAPGKRRDDEGAGGGGPSSGSSPGGSAPPAAGDDDEIPF